MADMPRTAFGIKLPAGADAEAHDLVRLANARQQDFGIGSQKRHCSVKGGLGSHFQPHTPRHRLPGEKAADLLVVALAAQREFDAADRSREE